METMKKIARAMHLRRPLGFSLVLAGAFTGLPASVLAQQAPAAAPAAPISSPQSTPAPASGSTVLAPVVIVGTTPLLGLGTPLSQVPANVQTVRARDLDRQHRATLADYFEKNLPSVDINEAQGNPYQTDVNYRGFTASPLLGTPQGLSVFIDGVRVNEPFGDVVNWDLIPEAAIDTMQLIPGSNPTYGLNTLGGALVITTRNGKTSPGGEAELTAGSWGRKTAQIQQGGTLGAHLDYYFTANAANDNGWAAHNASRVRQAFGKLRYTDADTTLAVSAGGADNTLEGAQALPRSFLGNPSQPYTFPDRNRNSVGYLTLSGDRALNDTFQLSGNAYYRHYRNGNLSSNTNNDFGTADATGAIDTLQGTNQQSVVTTDSYGANLQLTTLGTIAGHDNQLVTGVSADIANSRYTAALQDAFFNDQREAIGIGGFAPQTDAKTRSANYGIYLSDTFSLSKQWTLTLAGRYNWSSAQIGDASGTQPQLDGRHVFSRFNPAAGINWNPTPAFTTYVTYNEGMRVPTPVELTCADPAAPCSLPNAFSSDPALRPVISRTLEAGARGHAAADLQWSFAAFRTELHDDIQFISSGGGATNAGYFQNVGATRRQGVELGLQGRAGALALALHYSLVDATFRTPLVVNSPNNSTAGPIRCPACTDIQVRSGDRLPGIARSTFKLHAAWTFRKGAVAGMTLTSQGATYARGDENNADASGRVPGFTLVNLDARLPLGAGWEAFAIVDNLFDRRSASFGTLGQDVFTGPGRTFDPSGATWRREQFRVAGAPRGAWIGITWRFGDPA